MEAEAFRGYWATMNRIVFLLEERSAARSGALYRLVAQDRVTILGAERFLLL